MAGWSRGWAMQPMRCLIAKMICYETPPEALAALMRAENLPNVIWEPACGPGSIVRLLRALREGRLRNRFGGLRIARSGSIWMGFPNGNSGSDRRRDDFDQSAVQERWRVCQEGAGSLPASDHAFAVGISRKRPTLGNPRHWVGCQKSTFFANRLPQMHRRGWTGNFSNSWNGLRLVRMGKSAHGTGRNAPNIVETRGLTTPSTICSG